MARIFICYRREDSSGHAGRLYDRLGARFGDDVFMDIDAIGPGVDFARLIDETIDTVEAVIVVIGQEWLSSADADGSRRLDDPEDLVRQEISVALARDVLVIPVLVQGAVLPKPEDLPPELVGLTRHNAVRSERRALELRRRSPRPRPRGGARPNATSVGAACDRSGRRRRTIGDVGSTPRFDADGSSCHRCPGRVVVRPLRGTNLA